ncbi:MAG: HD domain-containing protein [Lachnospiraceae bacterium]|nr:HD domain-containing protein [Lachnospiraceae bacterium]
MLRVVYLTAFLISLGNIAMLLTIAKKQRCFYYLLIFFLITISSFGTLVIGDTDSLDVALLGNFITYFGAVYIPFCGFLAIAELCGVRVTKAHIFSALLVNALMLLLVWSSVAGRTFYYSEVSLIKIAGVSCLAVEPGQFRWVYTAYLFLYILSTLIVIVKAFINKHNISYKNIFACIILEIIAFVAYILSRHFNIQWEWINIAYILAEFVMLYLVYRICKYDVSEIVASSIEDFQEYGYMIFDEKLNYLGCNPLIKNIFPEIAHVRVDKPIEPMDYSFIPKALEWLKECVETGKSEHLYLEHGRQILKCSFKELNFGLFGRLSGYIVEVVDDTKQQKYMKLLANYNAQLEQEVNEKVEHIKIMQDRIILGMAEAVEGRDGETGGHVKRTSDGVRIFVEALKRLNKDMTFTTHFCEKVIKAAPMHDLGKIAVDDNILKKPGIFTPEEYEQMKCHPTVGGEMVKKVLAGLEDDELMNITRNVAQYHHERWDGKGYPKGLKGEEIPVEARIMALVDVFDTLVSERRYKAGMSCEEAFKIIEESLGTQFDPKLGKYFLMCRKEFEDYYNTI